MDNGNTVQTKPARFTLFLSFISILSVLSILGVVAVAAGLFYLKQDVKKLQGQSQNLQQTLLQNQQSFTAIQTTVQTLAAPQAKKARALSESAYLVQLADYNLHFQGNALIAVNLLQTADQQLSTVQDPAITSIRQTVANNILALQAVPPLDLAGLMLRLNAISQQIPQLPVVPDQLVRPLAAQLASRSSLPESLWQRGMDSLGHALKEMVVVRHVEQSAAPLLPPQQQVYLIQNIQLQLANAQWALIHQQQQVYQQSLDQASTWISHYFVLSAPTTQNVLAALTELQKVDTKPPLPDLSKTLEQIRSQLEQSAQIQSDQISVGPTTQEQALQ